MTFIAGMSSGEIDVSNRTPSVEPSAWAKKDIEEALDTGLLTKFHAFDYQYDINRTETVSLIAHYIVNNDCWQSLVDSSSEIKKLTDLGMIEGYTVHPDSQHEFLHYRRELTQEAAEPFSDTEYMPDIRLLYELNIVDGKEETLFYPYDNITREEFAKILSNTYHCVNKDAETVTVDKRFRDESDISDWAINSVNEMSALGILEGNENNEFLPQDNITKEEVIISLLRLSNL